MANPKNAAWYGGGINLIVGAQPGVGDIFYVDGTNGLDTNSGLTPDVPVLTITYALSLCTAGANDYIIVLGYPGDAGEASWPIPVSVSKVHIIGTPAQASPSPLINAPADTDCFTVSAANVEIAGLEFTAGATAACIATSGAIWKLHVHDNYFGWQAGAARGIEMPAGDDCPQCYIHNNWFGLGVTTAGIDIMHNSTRTIIEDNLFRVVTGAIGVLGSGLCTDIGAVRDNDFKVPDVANGEAISFTDVNAVNCLIVGNRAGQGAVALANNPYRDLGSQYWGLNHGGIAPMHPITV